MALRGWAGAMAFALTAAVPALSQTQPVAQASQPTPQTAASSGAIEGKVVNSVTGAPVRGAQVSYQQAGKSGSIAVTDGGGEFGFPSLPPGDYSFLVWAKDYESRLSSGNVNVKAGQTSSGVTLRLVPLSSMSGQITDDEGKPLFGIEVRLWRVTYLSGIRGMRAENGWTYSDREGRYTINSTVPGRYYMTASSDLANQPGAKEKDQERYVRRFYPGTLDPEAATPIDLSPGVDLPNVDFRLSKTPAVTVRGEVRSTSIADVTLVPETFQFNSGFSTKSVAPGGAFEVRDVIPGRYTAKAHIKRGDEEEWAELSIAVGPRDVENVTLLPVAAPSISGRIEVEGSPDGTDLSALAMELRPIDRASGTLLYFEKANRDGAVRIANLAPGRFKLSVSNLPPGYYLREVRSENQAIANRVLEITAGSAAHVEMTLSRDAATVTGSVYLDDPARPFPGATVVLVPQDRIRASDRLAYPSASADGAGHFSLHSVPPGDYLAFAWDDIDMTDNPFMDPAFMATVKTSGVPLSLAERANARIDIPVALGQ